MQILIKTQSRRPASTPKKRVKHVSDDKHLRADPANKRALDQGIAQIEGGKTVRFEPRKRQGQSSLGKRITPQK